MTRHESAAGRKQSFCFMRRSVPIKIEPRLCRSDDVKGLIGESGLFSWDDQKLDLKALFGG